MLCKLLEFVGNVILFYANLGSSLNRRTKNTLITDFNQLITLRENCPNMEFFLVRVFSHSNWIWRDTKYLSVVSPNAGKYRPEKTPYWTHFRQSIFPVSNALRVLLSTDLFLIFVTIFTLLPVYSHYFAHFGNLSLFKILAKDTMTITLLIAGLNLQIKIANKT